MVFLSINIKSLGLSSGKQIRETINTPQGVIEVYEPTKEMIGEIIDTQHSLGIGAEDDTVSFTGSEVIKNLFPILTNIDLTDLPDEELEEIIENPSIHLLIAQQLVAQILSEANKLYAERVKTELKNADSAIAQMDLIQAIPQMIVERAKVDGNVKELMESVEQAEGALNEAIEKEGKANLSVVEKEEKENADI